MPTAKKNPLGLPVGNDVIVGRVGRGVHTHIIHPHTREHICHSGINAGRPPAGVGKEDYSGSGAAPAVYESKAKFVTCYRCTKLGQMNMNEGRAAWDSGEGPAPYHKPEGKKKWYGKSRREGA